MSTSYYLFTARDIDGNLICINPRYEMNGITDIVPTYRNHSRTYFGETEEKLEEIGLRMNYSALPEAIKEKMCLDAETLGGIPVYAIDIEDIRKCIPEGQRHEHHGIYSKDRVFAFESGDIEDLYGDDISPEEYMKLDDTYRQKYRYYEWDNPTGWFVHLKELLDHIEWQIRDWEDYRYGIDETGTYYLLLIII